jgi:hypothetical protein
MPPRRLIPGEGAKYQNAVAYKADLHVKTSESAQKLLASLKNQALQNICKRCREKIEWKFKYGKYKHKKSASLLKCQNCEKSTVKLRYRKLCLSCAQESGRCPQCSKSQKEQELEDRAKREVANDGEEREEEEEEEETTDDEAYEEEGIVITRR